MAGKACLCELQASVHPEGAALQKQRGIQTLVELKLTLPEAFYQCATVTVERADVKAIALQQLL